MKAALRNHRMTSAVWCALLVGCGNPTSVQDDAERAAVEDREPRAPYGPDEGQLVLAIGQEASAPGTPVRVAFDAVLEDSRCPVDAICVWEGDARVALAIAVGSGSSTVHVLHWNTRVGPGSTMVGAYRVSLVSLDPFPRAEQDVPEEAYRVGVRVRGL